MKTEITFKILFTICIYILSKTVIHAQGYYRETEQGIDQQLYYYYSFDVLASGEEKYTLTNEYLKKVENEHIRSLRELFSISTSVSASLSKGIMGASASTTTNFEREILDQYRNLEMQVQNNSSTVQGETNKNEVYGTLFKKIRLKEGRSVNDVIVETSIRKFNYADLQIYSQEGAFDESLKVFCNARNIPINNSEIYTNYIYQPQGKVCHHTKFLQISNDNCVKMVEIVL
ncbi:hypothetical protein [Chondrinema litorale]|uniref:hypothetical protein n=1 Tax=Chondrinema litorale TaxID=2994555 RepID=UPI0025429363|nr:hypothetical protein [Chondrinema litorale]UZR99545.1 hypothetical protein OQ292_37410 [Chondrinema litorale]